VNTERGTQAYSSETARKKDDWGGPSHTVPYGTGLLGWVLPGTFVPGYNQTVPPGHFAKVLTKCDAGKPCMRHTPIRFYQPAVTAFKGGDVAGGAPKNPPCPPCESSSQRHSSHPPTIADEQVG
jgi:hypothetical protein